MRAEYTIIIVSKTLRKENVHFGQIARRIVPNKR
jgi:hypothetical protein